MKRWGSKRFGSIAILATLLAITAPLLGAKEKNPPVDSNDPTLRLYNLLDSTHGGKLQDFFVLGNVYTEAGQEYQHVLRLEYDKSKAFGRLTIHVRAVAKMPPDQAQNYTPKSLYDFGDSDLEKFVKTDPGEFGRQGDVYLRSGEDAPLATTPATDQAKRFYAQALSQYILPALEKK